MQGWLLVLFCVATGASLVTIGLRRRAYVIGRNDDPLCQQPAVTHHSVGSDVPPVPLPVSVPPAAPVPPPSLVPVATSTLASDLVWLRQLLLAVHGLIIGQTRAGKTTLTHFIATSRVRLGHRVIVCDPDAAPGMWPGCEVSGYADDFAAIERTLQAFQTEITARRVARTQRDRTRLTPLTLVFSEAGDIMNRCPSARAVFEAVLRRGGKLNISLLVDVQDRQRDTLNLPGATHLLKNFEEQVEVRRTGTRRYVIVEGRTYPLPTLPDPEELADAYARMHPRRASRPARHLLAELLEDDVLPFRLPPQQQQQAQPIHQQASPEPQTARPPGATSLTTASTPVVLPGVTAAPQIDAVTNGVANHIPPSTTAESAPDVPAPSATAESAPDPAPSATSGSAPDIPDTTVPAWMTEIAWVCPDNDRCATKGSVLELLRQARTEPAIVRELWHIDGTAGARYRKALTVVATIRADVLNGVVTAPGAKAPGLQRVPPHTHTTTS